MNPVFPSILSSNFFNLEERLRRFQSGGIGCIHLDIMDGHFVESISFGPALLRAIKAQFPFEADCHLMVSNPEKMIPQFVAAGADWISFHLEAVPQATKLIRQIREQGRRAGLVLNPDTPLARVFPYLGELDYVMLMGVYPGRGGQTFIDATLERTRELKTEIQRRESPCLIQLDGGINGQNIVHLREAGGDLFVVGTYLFNAADIEERLRDLYHMLQWGDA